jgi:hypothetical protein
MTEDSQPHQPTPNEALLARLKEVLPREAYKAAKRASSKGPLAVRLQKGPRGDQVLQVVALRAAGRINGVPFHARDPEWSIKPQKGAYHFEPTAQEAIPQRTTKRRQADKKHRARTLNAVAQALRFEGTRTEIQAYLDSHANALAIVEKADIEAVAHLDEYNWEEEMQYQAEHLRPRPLIVSVAGTKLLEHDAKEYRSVGSWGDVIAQVGLNVLSFVSAGAGGAIPEAHGAVGQGASAANSVIGGANDLKDAKEVPSKIGEAFHGKDESKKPDPKLSALASSVLGSTDPQQVYADYGLENADKNADWARKFIEDNLRFHLCIDEKPVAGALAQKSIPTHVDWLGQHVDLFPGKEVNMPMLVYSLSDVGSAFDSLITDITNKIHTDATAKTKTLRQREFAARGKQDASRGLPRMGGN